MVLLVISPVNVYYITLSIYNIPSEDFVTDRIRFPGKSLLIDWEIILYRLFANLNISVFFIYISSFFVSNKY